MRPARAAIATLLAVTLLSGCGEDKPTFTSPAHVHYVAAVQINPPALALNEAETFQLGARGVCECGVVLSVPMIWSSSDTTVATVDSTGLVTSVREGQVQIFAQSTGTEGPVVGKLALQVDREGVMVLPTGGVVSYLGGAVVLDLPDGALAEATKITIRPATASVTAERPGLVPGTTYHFRPDGLQLHAQARLTIRFEEGYLPAGIDPSRLSLYHRTQNGWVELAESQVDPAARTVFGPVEGFSYYGVAESGRPAVDRVVIEGTTGEPLMIGSTLQLVATLYDAAGNVLENRRVAWTSSDESVASVDPDGLVTGLARGDVTITATSEGVSESIGLMVRGEPTAGLGNNLSYPVIFAEGIGLGGLDVTAGPGLRPAPEEEIAVDQLPFFWQGNEPDYGPYYTQQGTNTWQAGWADGRSLAWSGGVTVSWGDNLTHHTFNTHAPIRVENALYAQGVAPMQGFAMTYLYGEGPDEMQGTDGSVYGVDPAVFSVLPRLTVEKLEGVDPAGDPGVPVCTVFDGAIHEGIGSEGPGAYGAEVNVSGKVIYGFNFTIRDVTLCGDAMHRYGWWRITFKLDPQGAVGGIPVQGNLDLVGIASSAEEGEEMLYTPYFDPVTNTTWLDIYVESASGGGGGGGGGGGEHEAP